MSERPHGSASSGRRSTAHRSLLVRGARSVRECSAIRAIAIALPLPLLAVGFLLGDVPNAAATAAAAVVVAAVTAAFVTRHCARRRMRRELEHHERELAHTKRQILGLVSHELRTPVTGVVGFSRTLAGRLDQLDHETLRLFVGAIDEHANRLERLIDNVVVASRTPLVVRDGTCQMSMVLARAVARVGTDRSRVRISLDGALHARIDDEAATRIVSNLIDNALKFGDPDAAVYIDGELDGAWIVMRVANAGPAIPVGLRSALYDPFVQSDPTDSRATDGLGLGLHICRQLVEAYGGSIELVDHPRLNVFEIALPAAPAAVTEPVALHRGARLGPFVPNADEDYPRAEAVPEPLVTRPSRQRVS